MRKLLPLLLFSTTAFAQPVVYFGQQQVDKQTTNCISPLVEKTIQDQLRIYRAGARSSAVTAATVLFAWPLRQRPPLDYTYYVFSNYVDLDKSAGAIVDYTGGSRTYDGHSGIDISPAPFVWDMMDNNRIEVLAAASGIIIGRVDNNDDRKCQADNSAIPNMIILQHEDNSTTRYIHLKKNSLTTKGVGQSVQAGEFLGLVGSSGNSSGPHLHFEVRDASDNVIEPFAGPRNQTTSSSRWINQKPYYDSQISQLMTHSSPPVSTSNCPANPFDVTNEQRSFVSGNSPYYGIYGRDWGVNQAFDLKIIKPDGSIHVSYSFQNSSPPGGYVNAGFSFGALPNPAPTGQWKFQVITLGTTYETVFNVNTTIPYAATNLICTDGGTELSVMNGGQTNKPNGPIFTYQWRLNGVDVPGALSNRYFAKQTGSYSVAVTKDGTLTVSNLITFTSASAQSTQKVGNWNDPTVWACGRVPTLTDNVLVNHSITMPANYTGQALTIKYTNTGKLVHRSGSQLRLKSE